MTTEAIFNFRKVSAFVLTGGMPTAEQLQAAAEEGVQVVINLATFTHGHSLPDEAQLVTAMGMEYHNIPVEWENPTQHNFETFEALLKQLGPVKILIHCAANYRATAFYALYAQKHLGWTEAQAEQFRMTIWQGSDYPVWEQFIQNMMKAL